LVPFQTRCGPFQTRCAPIQRASRCPGRAPRKGNSKQGPRARHLGGPLPARSLWSPFWSPFCPLLPKPLQGLFLGQRPSARSLAGHVALAPPHGGAPARPLSIWIEKGLFQFGSKKAPSFPAAAPPKVLRIGSREPWSARRFEGANGCPEGLFQETASRGSLE